ncbi:hypothetical protein X474_19925 [Dethiosulfatarculus sandiegensis]|uniref:Uncharacterized protein n=1 Tax=Dethiosulfatarculus sandiegensis TaxID=1429043 RepID=A0A0D2J215_9BACT|nr:hypothetical protein X474_19925 [Dethiosulfatarculus sandiegensis]
MPNSAIKDSLPSLGQKNLTGLPSLPGTRLIYFFVVAHLGSRFAPNS